MSPPQTSTPPRILREFLSSSASEDLKFAVAVPCGLRNTRGEYFTETNFDHRWSPQAGEEFKKQLAAKLGEAAVSGPHFLTACKRGTANYAESRSVAGAGAGAIAAAG